MLVHALLHFVRGFAMGSADIVPGVSGGTIALVLGIYERFIASIRAGSKALTLLVRADVPGFRRWLAAVEWAFLIPLGVGILVAVLTLAHLISDQLQQQPEHMSAIFLGLVAGSVVVAWRLIRQPRAQLALTIALVAVVTFVALGLRDETGEESGGQLTDPALWAFFLAGAIAICAMILPGVSGSFLLVILGMYGPVLAAVTDRDLIALGVFMLGAVLGLAVFSQVLHLALQRAHDPVLAVLIGLMAGSIRVLWPWPDGVDSTALGMPDDGWLIAIGLALAAFGVVVVVARYAQALEAADEHPDAEPDGPTGSPDAEGPVEVTT